MTWMTPFEASMSALVTLAPLTVTPPSRLAESADAEHRADRTRLEIRGADLASDGVILEDVCGLFVAQRGEQTFL